MRLERLQAAQAAGVDLRGVEVDQLTAVVPMPRLVVHCSPVGLVCMAESAKARGIHDIPIE